MKKLIVIIKLLMAKVDIILLVKSAHDSKVGLKLNKLKLK